MSKLLPDLLGKLHSALESSDEKWLQEVLANCDLETLQECVLADPTIFVHICARGYVTAAHHLQINCSVNLTAAVEGVRFFLGTEYRVLYSSIMGNYSVISHIEKTTT